MPFLTKLPKNANNVSVQRIISNSTSRKATKSQSEIVAEMIQ